MESNPIITQKLPQFEALTSEHTEHQSKSLLLMML